MGSQWNFCNKWKPKNEIIICISLSWKPFALFLWMSSCKDISPTSSALKYIFLNQIQEDKQWRSHPEWLSDEGPIWSSSSCYSSRDGIVHYWQFKHSVGPVHKAAEGWRDQSRVRSRRWDASRRPGEAGTATPQEGTPNRRQVEAGQTRWGQVTKLISETVSECSVGQVLPWFGLPHELLCFLIWLPLAHS